MSATEAPAGVDPETPGERFGLNLEALAASLAESLAGNPDPSDEEVKRAARKAMLTASKTTTYRFCDRDGNVLRVGCTTDLKRRIRQYRHENPWWWSKVWTVITSEFSTRPLALACEKDWIRLYDPPGNSQRMVETTAYERTREGAVGTAKYGLGQVIGMFCDDLGLLDDDETEAPV